MLEIEELNREFTRFSENKQERAEHDKHSDTWLDLFREKQRLEEEVSSLQAQVPGTRVFPAMKVGMADYDFLVETLGRKKKQVREIEERMSRS